MMSTVDPTVSVHLPPSTIDTMATEASTTAVSSYASTTSHGVNGTAAAPRHIWIVTGPAGSGKTTVAEYLANQFGLPYIEGDKYHSAANIAKMANNIPLTDADRWDWLILLRDEALKELQCGASGVVVTCSALKQRYRDVIRIASYNRHNVVVRFVYLSASVDMLMARLKARKDHYMKDTMLKSQFRDLEPPTMDETDVSTVDCSVSLAEAQALAKSVVQQVMARDGNVAVR